MNLLALPAFVMDPAAAAVTTHSSVVSIDNDGSQAANNEFLEMLLASEAAFQGTVPLAPQPPATSEATTEVFEDVPVVPAAPTLIPAVIEPVSPTSEEAQDQAATTYAMVATMQVAPDAEETGSTGRLTAASIARADLESSEEESEEIEEMSFAPSSTERLDVLTVPTAVPVPAPLEVLNNSEPSVTDAVDVSEIKFGRPTSNAVFSESSERTIRPSNDAPVILEALVTPKSGSAADALSDEPLPKQVDPISDPPSSLAPESRPETFELPSQRDSDNSANEEHSDAPAQENVSEIDKAVPFANVASTSSAAKPQRPATTEVPRQTVPVVDEKHLQNERTPLKQMDVRIPDSNGDVTVRLQERAGALHVSVRSSDSQIANGVANALPELTRSLDAEGFRAETWTPQVNSLGDVRVDDSAGAVTFSRFESQSVLQTDQPQTDDGQGDRQSEPDWKEQQDKRRKRQSEEEFKENLW